MGSQDFSEVIWERFLRGEEKFNQLFKGCFLLDLAWGEGRAFQGVGERVVWRQKEVESWLSAGSYVRWCLGLGVGSGRSEWPRWLAWWVTRAQWGLLIWTHSRFLSKGEGIMMPVGVCGMSWNQEAGAGSEQELSLIESIASEARPG